MKSNGNTAPAASAKRCPRCGDHCTCKGWSQFLSAVFIMLNIVAPSMAGLWLLGHDGILDVGVGLGLGLLFPIAWTLLAVRPGNVLIEMVKASRFGGNIRAMTGAAFLAALLQYAALAAWTLVAFMIFARNPCPGDLPVYLAWGYGSVMAPITAMALHKLEPGSTRTLAVWFALGACAASALGCVSFEIEALPGEPLRHIGDAVWALSTLTLVGALANAGLFGRNLEQARRAGAASADAWSKNGGKKKAA